MGLEMPAAGDAPRQNHTHAVSMPVAIHVSSIHQQHWRLQFLAKDGIVVLLQGGPRTGLQRAGGEVQLVRREAAVRELRIFCHLQGNRRKNHVALGFWIQIFDKNPQLVRREAAVRRLRVLRHLQRLQWNSKMSSGGLRPQGFAQ